MGSSQILPAENFNTYVWENTAKIIPDCLEYKNTASQQFFEVATHLFKLTSDACPGALDVSSYVHEWSRLLLEHEHEEVSRITLSWLFFTNER